MTKHDWSNCSPLSRLLSFSFTPSLFWIISHKQGPFGLLLCSSLSLSSFGLYLITSLFFFFFFWWDFNSSFKYRSQLFINMIISREKIGQSETSITNFHTMKRLNKLNFHNHLLWLEAITFEYKSCVPFCVFHFMFHQLQLVIFFFFFISNFGYFIRKVKQYKSCDWWNIKWNKKNGTKDLYS